MAETVLITGANSGIGLATSIEAARLGYRAVGGVRSRAKAESVKKAATAARVKVETVIFDVTDAAACERVVDELEPWAVVNNAGFVTPGAVEDVPDDEARRYLETMVVAPMRLARLALRHMRKRKAGRIVNVSSIYGRMTTPLTGWYQASKHALEALSDALRVEVASTGIKVVLIEPGGFKTGIWEGMERPQRGSRYREAYRRTAESLRVSQPLMGEPSWVAAVVGKALTARFPRSRYLVGYDAQMIALVEPVVPTPLKDWIARLTLGL
jgi:NAD(P)-dependent dehydrogenase (short-subunit alcohol dehydrogenase family)